MKFLAEIVEEFTEKYNDLTFLIHDFIENCYFLRYRNNLLCFRYLGNDNDCILEENDKIEVSLIKDGFFDVIFGYKNLTISEIDELLKVLLDEPFFKVCILLKDIINIDYKLLGVANQRYYSYDDIGDDYELMYHASPVMFLQNKKTNEYIAVHLYTSFGMCPSGYCSATWGYGEVTKLDDNFDLNCHDILYFPQDEIIVHMEESDGIYYWFIDNNKFLDKRWFGVIDFEGDDCYYPSGGAYINLPLENINETKEFEDFLELFYRSSDAENLTDMNNVIPFKFLEKMLKGEEI